MRDMSLAYLHVHHMSTIEQGDIGPAATNPYSSLVLDKGAPGRGRSIMHSCARDGALRCHKSAHVRCNHANESSPAFQASSPYAIRYMGDLWGFGRHKALAGGSCFWPARRCVFAGVSGQPPHPAQADG